MILESLYLHYFRNFEEAHLDFGPGINLFSGNNAQGKTNLLEAIILLSTGRSFRTQRLSELIRENSPFFFLEAQIQQGRVAQVLRMSFDGQQKKVETNAAIYSSFQPLLGTLPSVLYAPGDLDLISGAPVERRRFANIHLAQCDPLYVHHLLRYLRAMKQRNSLLRQNNSDGIECWEQEMARSSDYLIAKRRAFFEGISKDLLPASCKELQAEISEVRYTSFPCSEEHLKKNRVRDKLLGLTSSGPHRDDFTLFINEKNAKAYASEGQKRSSIAALRLAEWKLLLQESGKKPLLCIDDLELHLDPGRQQLFRQALEKQGCQTFIATTNTDPWPGARRHQIHAGTCSKITAS